ncbi:hypothetical protein E2C01_061739 [Portunus trituberculatus]|uniref:Uncharacterized protein n=1 Tax=Portunus trituberculatus TaxID=210409 RepID=A0A5B7H8Z0_PORTR|nr:hypothetical protein [Portunus trituberculatus]
MHFRLAHSSPAQPNSVHWEALATKRTNELIKVTPNPQPTSEPVPSISQPPLANHQPSSQPPPSSRHHAITIHHSPLTYHHHSPPIR